MTKCKTKHANKVTTVTTRCNMSVLLVVNVVTSLVYQGYLKVTTGYHIPLRIDLFSLSCLVYCVLHFVVCGTLTFKFFF